MVACQIREWEPENATVSESIENVKNTANNDLMIRGTVRQNEMTTDVLFIIRKEDTDNKYKIVDEVEMD